MTGIAPYDDGREIKIVWRSAVPLPDGALERLTAACPRSVIVLCPGDADLAAHLSDAEVMIGGAGVDKTMLAAAPRLRWIQTLAVGVDGFLDPAIAEHGVIVTNGRGVAVSNLAEHAMGMMLWFARGMPELARRQSLAQWKSPHFERPPLFDLEGQTLGIVGFGEIGRAVALRASAFGMTIWGMRRHAATPGETIADRMFGPGELHALAAGADHLLVVAPLTPETRVLVDRTLFAAIKPGAHFYNLARGAIVDHDALLDALREGVIAGAGLDATDPEPLPAASPLWTMPNVIITGHTAGHTPHFFVKMLGFIEQNLRRYAQGEPLHNVVRATLGY